MSKVIWDKDRQRFITKAGITEAFIVGNFPPHKESYNVVVVPFSGKKLILKTFDTKDEAIVALEELSKIL